MCAACTWAWMSLGRGPLWLPVSSQTQAAVLRLQLSSVRDPSSVSRTQGCAAEGLQSCCVESHPAWTRLSQCMDTASGLWGFKSFIQNCSKNLPPCHSLIPSRLYHPDLQSSALGCGSHLMNVLLSLEIQHHLSNMNIWLLLHTQTQTYTPPCIMISRHLLTSPDKDTTLDSSKDLMPKAFPFPLQRWPSSGFLLRNLSMGLGEIWWKLQAVGTCSYPAGSTGKREVQRFQRGRAGALSGSCPASCGWLPACAGTQQPSWMTDWAAQCCKLRAQTCPKGLNQPFKASPKQIPVQPFDFSGPFRSKRQVSVCAVSTAHDHHISFLFEP